MAWRRSLAALLPLVVDVGIDFVGPARGHLGFLLLGLRTLGEFVRDGRAMLRALRLRFGLLAELERLAPLALQAPFAGSPCGQEEQDDGENGCNCDDDPDPGPFSTSFWFEADTRDPRPRPRGNGRGPG